MKTTYFSYSSNMNAQQMAFRCPDAEAVGPVRLKDYRLVFRGSGVATIIPESGSHVDGVLWRISEQDEHHLDHYEGYPILYGKEPITVSNRECGEQKAMVYTMNPPYRDTPALPTQLYLEGILEGYKQNGLEIRPVLEAYRNAQHETRISQKNRKNYPFER